MKKHRYNIWPSANEEDFRPIVDDMKANGYDASQPVVVYQGEILDGWNRWQAAQEAGVTAVTREFEGTASDALLYTLRTNKRRNLTSSQRATLAAKAEGLLSVIAEEVEKARREKQAATLTATLAEQAGCSLSQKIVTNSAEPEPRDQNAESAATKVAELFSTNRTYVSQATKLMDEEPELFAQVEAGEVSMSQAVKAAKKKKRQQQIAERHQAHTEATKAAAQIVPRIERADCLEWLRRQEPCDLLLTDPPYSTDVDDVNAFAEAWLPLALSKVKDTGRAYVCIGAYPEELAAYMRVAMPTQILVWTYKNTLGPTPKGRYKQNWQAVLYYAKDKAEPLDCQSMLEQFSVQEINAPDGRLGDRYHAWQKPLELAERFIRHSTKPGDVVLDPFACTGTFLLAAAKLGRRAAGCDIDEANIAIAVERGCEQ